MDNVLGKLHQDEIDAIQSYQKGIVHFADDPGTARLLKHIQGEEKEHKAELEERMKDVATDRAKVHLGGKKSKASKPSKGKKSKKGPIHRMVIRRSANDGFIAEHQFEPNEEGRQIEPDEHTIPDLETLKAHVGEHFAPEEEEGGEGGGERPEGGEAMA